MRIFIRILRTCWVFLMMLQICLINIFNACIYYAENIFPILLSAAIVRSFYWSEYSKVNGFKEILKLFFKISVVLKLFWIFICAIGFSFSYYLSVPIVFILGYLFMKIKDFLINHFKERANLKVEKSKNNLNKNKYRK